MSEIKFVDLHAEYQQIKLSVEKNINQVMQHGCFIMGPEVTLLENSLAKFNGAKHCIAVGNGTDAIYLALLANNIGAGDEVITTPFTFFATIEPIILLGAKPVFVDIDPITYNINAKLIESAITPNTKAILPVSLYGQCAEMQTINQIANKHNLIVIEDAAQSFGAQHHQQYSGNLSTIGCTSFFPTKPLGCYGDGGACFTNDDEIANAIRELRVHGQPANSRHYHVRLGINSRLDSLQAGILLSKLEIFNQSLQLRQQAAQNYMDALQNIVQIPYILPHNRSAFGQYTIRINQNINRDAVRKILAEKGIPTAVHYPMPSNQQPIMRKYGYDKISLPEAELAAKQILSLPMHPLLTEQQQAIIVQELSKSLQTVSANSPAIP